jgi:hypothetical protein
VSTDDHNLAFQLSPLQQAGCTTICTDAGLHEVKSPPLTRDLQAPYAGDTLMLWIRDH